MPHSLSYRRTVGTSPTGTVRHIPAMAYRRKRAIAAFKIGRVVAYLVQRFAALDYVFGLGHSLNSMSRIILRAHPHPVTPTGGCHHKIMARTIVICEIALRLSIINRIPFLQRLLLAQFSNGLFKLIELLF